MKRVRKPVARQHVMHPLAVRVTHWINAFAIAGMVMSGWEIYDASPLFPFRFPPWATLGGWLGGAVAWHLAMMWLLVCNGLIYIAYNLAGGRFRRVLLPVTPATVWHDIRAALALRLVHHTGTYNAVQRLAYIVVLLLGVLAVVSGLALWKPVQLPFATLLGGYEVARRVHFAAMAGIVAFLLLHLTLVMLVPRTLVSMLTGRTPKGAAGEEAHP